VRLSRDASGGIYTVLKASREFSNRIAFAVSVLAMLVAPGRASADWPAFGRALTTALGDQLGSAMTSDGAGGAIVTWRDQGSVPRNIDIQHVLASGEVDAAWPVNGRVLLPVSLALSIDPQTLGAPSLVQDGAGGAIVIWSDGRSVVNGSDIYAQHILASGVVDPSWPVNGATVCSVVGEQIGPASVSDGAGGAFISWTDNRAGPALSDRDIYAQHVLASGQTDPNWPANGTAVTTAPQAQISPGIVADGVGGILVTWSDLRTGNPGMDLFAEHVLESGALDPAWPVNGFGVCTAPGTQTSQSMIPDGTHGMIVAWDDTRDGTNEIFAQRVTISGTIVPGWPTNGRAVSVGGTDEVFPTIVTDGGNGAIVAWGGGNSGHHNMLAQHLLDSGVLDPAWSATGNSLGSANSEQQNQSIASDGHGGAIVAWQQSDDLTQIDIFAQHVLASGALDSAYPASGRSVCALLNLQHEPHIVAAGTDGAIVAWMDTRDGLTDVYALQVLQAGTVGVPNPTGATEISFARPTPNPSRGSLVLRYQLPRAAPVSLAIFDIAGRRVRDLISGSEQAGAHAVDWDLRDARGEAVQAGVYIARLDVGRRTLTQKLIAVGSR
jgi:flagellar hook capping protein FlgD